MTPREKWDAGVKLTEAELDALLADGRLAEQIIAALDLEEPRAPSVIATAVGRPVAEILPILQHLAQDPVWLVRETPEGWLASDGEEPPQSGPQRAPGAPPPAPVPRHALLRLGPLSEAALANDGGLAALGLGSAYAALAPPAPRTVPLLHLRTDPAIAELSSAIVRWGRQFAGQPWSAYAPRLPGLFAAFLQERFPWLRPDAVAELVGHVHIGETRIDLDVRALQARLAELAPVGSA